MIKNGVEYLKCLDMEKIFDEVFNEKHTEKLNYEYDIKEVL